MNERIKELVRESNLDVYGLGKERYKWEYTVEKFAELIVRECISTIENAENGYQDYRNQIEDGMRNHCISLIKNKFEIEE